MMRYTELCKEDQYRLKCLNQKCAKVLKDLKCTKLLSDNKSKYQFAYNLYLIGTGIYWHENEQQHYFKLDFESLDELEMKLAMRGF